MLAAIVVVLVTLRLTADTSPRAVVDAPGRVVVASPAVAEAALHPTGISYGTLRWGNLDRRWRLYVPPGSGSARLPLLVLLHPAGGAADSFATATSMDFYAATYRFITVAPEGVDGTWNAGSCCGSARNRQIDDVGFVNAMLDRLIATAPVDGSQVYAAGASNGGMLAYALGCRLADRFQAVFSAGGAQTLGDCHPARPISIVEFHSLADTLVPFYGGVDPKYVGDLTPFGSTQSTFRSWAATDECPTRSVSDAGAGEQVEVWYGCADSTLLEVWLRITGGGHEWPTAPQAPVDASRTIAKAVASGRLLRRPGPSADPLVAA
ncbi:MAG: CE1 family esterase [Acidimicrobiales bacterium]